MIKRCTFCGNEISSMKFNVDLSLSGERKTLGGKWEKIDTLDIKKSEELCKKCFDTFLDSLDIEKGE